MADTTKGDYPFQPCSDCGKVGGCYIKHWGPLVPPGAVGFFDDPCIGERRDASNRGESPKPLGYKKVPAEATTVPA